MIYCVIPQALADELYDKMVEYYKDDPNVTVIIDRRKGPDRRAGREGNLHLVGVAVGVDTDHGVDEFCQHGHRPGSFRRERVERSAPAWVEVTERHICDRSRPRADRLLISSWGSFR